MGGGQGKGGTGQIAGRLVLRVGYGAERLAPRRGAPSCPSPVSIRHRLSSLTPPPGPGRGSRGQGPKEAPGWAGPGRERVRSIVGGRDRKGCQSLRSGQASRPAPLPHPRPSTPRLRGGGHSAVKHVPRRASCHQLRPAAPRWPDARHPAAAPPQTTPLASARWGAGETAGLERPTRPEVPVLELSWRNKLPAQVSYLELVRRPRRNRAQLVR